MTEILGSDDAGGRASGRRSGWRAGRPDPDPVAGPTPPQVDDPGPRVDVGFNAGLDPHLDAGLPVELLGDDWDDDPDPGGPARPARLLGALGEAGSLAVASGLCLVVGALAGPSYRFDAYPFNQGISSLGNVGITSLVVHPLHDYLMAAAPSIALAVAGVLTALAALGRGRPDQPGWVRPLAGGALLASVLVLVLLGLGAYRTSTYELSPPSANAAAASTG